MIIKNIRRVQFNAKSKFSVTITKGNSKYFFNPSQILINKRYFLCAVEFNVNQSFKNFSTKNKNTPYIIVILDNKQKYDMQDVNFIITSKIRNLLSNHEEIVEIPNFNLKFADDFFDLTRLKYCHLNQDIIYEYKDLIFNDY